MKNRGIYFDPPPEALAGRGNRRRQIIIRSPGYYRPFMWVLILLLNTPLWAGKDVQKMTPEELTACVAAGPGQEQMACMNEKAFKIYLAEPTEAESLARQAIELAEKYGDTAAKANGLVVLGLIAGNEGDTASAGTSFRQALEIRKKKQDWTGVASCYNNLGNLYKNRAGHYLQAIRYFEQGFQALDKAPNPALAATIHNNLGNVLTRMGEYDAARRRLEEGLEIRKNFSSGEGVAYSLLNLGTLYQEMGAYEESDKLLEESLAIFENLNRAAGQGKCQLLLGNNDFLREGYKQALDHYARAAAFETELDADDRARIRRNQGSAYFQGGQPEKAQQNYRLSRHAFQRLQNGREVAALDFDLGNIHLAQLNLDSAGLYYDRSLAQLTSTPDYKLKFNIQTNRHLLAQLQQERLAAKNRNLTLGSITGLFFFLLALTAISLFANSQRQKKELAAQEAEIANQEAEIATQEAKIANQEAEIATQEAEIANQKAALAFQKVDQLMSEQELVVSRTRQEAQDAERNRIAKDLHDRIGSMLSMIKLKFDGIDKKIENLAAENRLQFSKAIEMLDEACVAVRKISHDLDSGILEKFGLKMELEVFKESLQGSTDLEVELVTHGLEKRLDRKTEKNIRDIIFELVTNVIKHARASKITITVSRLKNVINFMVEDNGIGFLPEQAGRKDGLGLKSVAYRAQDLGGHMQIDSRQGRGTTVNIDIPITEAAATG